MGRAALLQMGLNIDAENINAMLHEADADSSGGLDQSEFEAAMLAVCRRYITESNTSGIGLDEVNVVQASAQELSAEALGPELLVAATKRRRFGKLAQRLKPKKWLAKRKDKR